MILDLDLEREALRAMLLATEKPERAIVKEFIEDDFTTLHYRVLACFVMNRAARGRAAGDLAAFKAWAKRWTKTQITITRTLADVLLSSGQPHYLPHYIRRMKTLRRSRQAMELAEKWWKAAETGEPDWDELVSSDLAERNL